MQMDHALSRMVAAAPVHQELRVREARDALSLHAV